ncbi:histidine kinase [Pseudoclavibacter sp. AY1F1]|uniref:sensor histidine kinase n=1 Tax=Pseudoclavibacter sp. AY1F1 TaxID=2080583 RepID=UPI000CE9214C|nr:histidine kinase [Pseudoclavibacter sp. AY1F1]PPF43369.1 histidine kinase [Pseudoclavibacter sp. AY1F1]
MTDGRFRGPRAAADLRWMRGSTAVTLWALVIIGCFLQFTFGLDGAPEPRRIALIIASAASAILAIAVIPMLLRPDFRASARHPIFVALISLCVATWALALIPPFAGWGWAFLFAIAGGMLSCVVPLWWRVGVLALTLAALALGFTSAGPLPAPTDGVSAISDAASTFVVVGTLALMTVMPLSAVWVFRVVLRLEEARRMASDLAVATERLRFATDLHDIQGHHLQVIALKSELAERRLLADEPGLAADELAAIRSIAKAALEDTRAVVNNYRTVTVAVEARNAAAVLRSAGIACQANLDAPELTTPLGAVFALAIRESATNILRHSKATEASLELVRLDTGGYRLTVTNNGAGTLRATGTGIAGITERVGTWNGTVTTSRHNDTFTLVVCIPTPTEPHRSDTKR